IHSPEVRVGRIQNFKNWSPHMVPDPQKSCVGMEYFASRGDDLWEMSDEGLMELATRELEQIGLARANLVSDGTVIRQPKAYPVYDETYRANVDVIRNYLEDFKNLQTVGRAGIVRYINIDHSESTDMHAGNDTMSAVHDQRSAH